MRHTIDQADADLLSYIRRYATIGEAVVLMNSVDAASTTARLAYLAERGLVRRWRAADANGRMKPQVEITAAGRSALDNYRATVRTPSRTVGNAATSGDYVPNELRMQANRPGALDAFFLPSLISGERVPHFSLRQEVAHGH